MTAASVGTSVLDAFSCYPSGVVALAAQIDDGPDGMAVSSFAAVSVEPAIVSVSVSRTSRTWQRLRRSAALGISVLGAEQDAAARAIASRTGDRFADVTWTAAPDGAVVLSGAPATFEGTILREVEAGDHTVVLIRIHRFTGDPRLPALVRHGRRHGIASFA